MSTYLGIDLGTSATKALILRSDGSVTARSRAAHREARSAAPGRVDPTAWMASIADACAQLGPALHEISGIGLSVHSPTALLYDADGTPTTLGITWDHTALPRYAADLASLRDAAEQRLAGNHESPATFMIAAYRFFETHELQALERATEFGLVGSWLSRWLTGVSALDPTQASYTGAYATTSEEMRWLGGFLARANIQEERLPHLQPSLSIVGTVHARATSLLGLPTGIPVIVGAADTPSASFALGVKPAGTPLLVIGTTHVISNCLKRPDPRALALQRADVRGERWLINGVTNGGDSLATGARLLGYGTGTDAVGMLVAEAASVSPLEAQGAPAFIPHVMPERGPLWLANRATVFCGFDVRTTPRVGARAVLEGVLFADRMVVENCVSNSQREIFLSGAGTGETAMPQLVADVLDRTIHVVEEASLSARGAASMAAEVLEGASVRVPPTHTVRPRAEWQSTIGQRWDDFRPLWEKTVGRSALEPMDVSRNNFTRT